MIFITHPFLTRWHSTRWLSVMSRIKAEPSLLSASLPHRDREHKKKPSPCVSNEAVRSALTETQREEGVLAFPHRVVSLKFLTFRSTIALQLQIDKDV